MKVEDVIIIGGGPAGISCAIQLTRYNIEPVIVEKENIGGLLLNANNLENYPGFPKGITGTELAELLKEHLKRQKIKVLFEEVIELTSNEELFEIITNKTSYFSKFTVIASGTKPKKFGDCLIPDELVPKVFYEVYPLGTLRNKKIAIVGAGDAAFDYALNLEKGNEIVLLNRAETSKCIPVLFERVEKSPKITYIKNIRIQTISSFSRDIITLECITPKGVRNIETNYLLVAIGRVPCLDFLSPDLKKKILKNNTNNRLYLAGDVKNDIFRQTAIATGDGIITAMKINNEIKKDT